MPKKLITLAFIMLLFINVNNVFAYTDTQGHWAEKDINKLSVNGIVSGYHDNTFKPNNNMTRAELITVINRILANNVQNTRYVPDISETNWYYVEIRKGIESGFVAGDNDGYVRPNDLITREEAVCMIQRALVPQSEEKFVSNFIDDEDVSAWAKDSLNTFIANNYISGYKDGTFRPQSNITRAEVSKIITNIIDTFVSYGELTGDIYGDILVNGNGVVINNATIHGNLFVTEGGANLSLSNIIVEKNFIYRIDLSIPETNFVVNGKTSNIKPEPIVDKSKYSNSKFGISFSIPDGAKVFEENNKSKVDYKAKNLITIRFNHDDKLYNDSFDEGRHRERYRFSLPYKEIHLGMFDYYKYALYGTEDQSSYFIYIKRDNVEYIISFYNVVSSNIVDNVVNSIKLFEGSEIENHRIKTYRNPELFLKFNYVDYVAVDDSYNTGLVNDEEGLYKLFIQVTNILDMSDYTTEQLKDILLSLEDTGSEVLDSKVAKVYTYDAIEYTLRNDGKITKSLYVMISTKLYHFIFTSEEDRMQSAGEEIYKDIINNIEF